MQYYVSGPKNSMKNQIHFIKNMLKSRGKGHERQQYNSNLISHVIRINIILPNHLHGSQKKVLFINIFTTTLCLT